MKKFVIAATGRSMNYLPEYLAQELNYFQKEGVDVLSYTPTPWVNGLNDLNDKKADVMLGGIWVPIMYHENIKNYMSIAKVASKCPLCILSKEKISSFSWKNLEDKRVLVSGGDGASHYAVTLGIAKKSGVDTSKIRFIHDFSTKMICDLFEGGFGDFIVLQPDIAQLMIEKHQGYLFVNLAETNENIPWSVYYALPEKIVQEKEKFTRFTMGLQKGTQFLLENGGVSCKNIIQKYWPHITVDEGIKTINNFIDQGMWTSEIDITQIELNYWQEFLSFADLLDKQIPYEKLVNNITKKDVDGADFSL